MGHKLASQGTIEQQMLAARARRAAEHQRLKRHIEMGYVAGKILPSGAIQTTSRKGFVPMATRDLVAAVRALMVRSESYDGRRVCHINNKHQLQIRGKDLRRLLKAMPGVSQVGRMLIETPK